MFAKNKMLNFLRKTTGRNTFSVAQGRVLFGIQNIAARIHELRQAGFPIYTNDRKRADGTSVLVYRLGVPSRSLKAAARKTGTTLRNETGKVVVKNGRTVR